MTTLDDVTDDTTTLDDVTDDITKIDGVTDGVTNGVYGGGNDDGYNDYTCVVVTMTTPVWHILYWYPPPSSTSAYN